MTATRFAFCAALLILAGPSSAQVAMDSVPPGPASQVTLMNWTEQPYNRWSFRNAGIHPSLMVPRSGGSSDLPAEPNPEVANIAFDYRGQPFSVRSAMVADGTDGYLVIKEGKLVHEEYFGDFGEHDHHLWASSTKSLVGLCMGILVEEGKVKVEDKVATYLPELADTYFGQRTVRELLNMVTALNYSEDYTSFTPGAVSTEYFRRLGFIPAFDLMGTDPTEKDVPRGILEFVPRFTQNPALAPSDRFEYHSPNVDVAGWIIARLSGKTLDQYVAENVWSKLGAEHDAFFGTDVGFNPIATGGFNTTLRDFARVGLIVLGNGTYNGQQIFPADWVNETFALTDEERRQVARSVYKDPDAPVHDERLEGYKNYLWIHDSQKGIGTFRGVFGQNLYINKEKSLIVATFSSAASASNAARAANKPRMAAFEAIADQLD